MITGWLESPIVRRHAWTPDLTSVVLEHRLEDFEPGQFVNLGIDVDGRRVKRAYSVVSAPGEPAEFLVVRVEDGLLTPPLFGKRVGDPVLLLPRAAGYFTLRWVPDAPMLWMIATGTGLAPFLSMLRAGAPWERFGRVVLVHGVRQGDNLAYRDEISTHAAQRPGRLVYVPVVSRERTPGALHGRVTTALTEGLLEEAADHRIGPETDQVMLCGNPAMLDEMEAMLQQRRGLHVNRRRAPGQVTLERYW